MTKRNERFAIEFVVLFGFLDGLWIHAGVNPQAEIVRAFTDLVPEMSSLWFWIIVTILTVGPLVIAYRIGEWRGIIGILFAFLGGIFIETVGIWLLLIGIAIGWFAPLSKH